MKNPIIPKRVLNHWLIGRKGIFESVYRYDRASRIYKFSYQPKSGELLFDVAPAFHNALIQACGTKPFEKYIRGICFWEKKVIYLRGHEREDWLKITSKMLRRHGVKRDIRIIWGDKAAKELEEDLKGL